MNRKSALRTVGSLCALVAALTATSAGASSVVTTTIYTLQGSDGTRPVGRLAVGPDGNLYGAASNGGSAADAGAIFRVTPYGAFTKLVTFDGANGASPIGSLVVGVDGNFYGATFSGGSNDSGTVFRMTPNGALTKLVDFPTDANPSGGLVAASDGNFYGMGLHGVYKVTTAGQMSSLANVDGAGFGFCDLIQGKDGKLYGTTFFGGTNNAGTIFSATLSGVVTTLVSFGSNSSGGAHPGTGVVQGADGALYGGTYGTLPWEFPGPGPTIFRFSLPGQYGILNSGRLSTLITSFDPNSVALLSASDGNLYAALEDYLFGLTDTGTVTNLGIMEDEAPLVQTTDGTMYAALSIGDIVRVHRVTKLLSRGVVSMRPFSEQVVINPEAVLTDSMNGAPIAGRWVGFWFGANYLCGNWTGSDGIAKCQATVQQHLQAVIAQGVSATFDDDGTFAASQATAEISCVGNNCL